MSDLEYATYQACADYEDRTGRPPTIRELSVTLGIGYSAAYARCRLWGIDLPRDAIGRRPSLQDHRRRMARTGRGGAGRDGRGTRQGGSRGQ